MKRIVCVLAIAFSSAKYIPLIAADFAAFHVN